MFVKILTIALTSFFASSAEAALWNGLAASWSLNPSTNFYALPRMSQAAKNEGWTPISGVKQAKDVEALGYRDDPTIVLLFQNEIVFGVQVAFPVSEVNKEQPVKWAELDTIIPKKLNGKLFYTAMAYFLEDERRDTRRIWLEEKHRAREIPTKRSKVLSETPWSLKKCVPTMGIHQYEWNPASNYNTTLNPWGLMAMGDEITGLLFPGFESPRTMGSRVWWEKIPDGGLFGVVPDPPQCAVDAIAEFGALPIHIWFVDKPQKGRCN